MKARPAFLCKTETPGGLKSKNWRRVGSDFRIAVAVDNRVDLLPAFALLAVHGGGGAIAGDVLLGEDGVDRQKASGHLYHTSCTDCGYGRSSFYDRKKCVRWSDKDIYQGT